MKWRFAKITFLIFFKWNITFISRVYQQPTLKILKNYQCQSGCPYVTCVTFKIPILAYYIVSDRKIIEMANNISILLNNKKSVHHYHYHYHMIMLHSAQISVTSDKVMSIPIFLDFPLQIKNQPFMYCTLSGDRWSEINTVLYRWDSLCSLTALNFQQTYSNLSPNFPYYTDSCITLNPQN